MTYGQIITLLFIVLVLYYAGLITMDIIAAKRMKASDEAKNEEAEIDISGLAGGFEPVEIKRANAKPATAPQNIPAVDCLRLSSACRCGGTQAICSHTARRRT